MSRNYDNWERLVAAVLRKELIWKLCHQQSRTPSLTSSSISSSFSFSHGFPSFSGTSCDFTNPKDGFLRSAQSLPFKTVAGISTKESAAGRRFVVLKGSSCVFSIEELMNAPCFVLGDELETFTKTYVVRFGGSANIMDMVVVKRLNVEHEAFQRNMKSIDCIEHENVVASRGYYYLSDDEILGFYDYFPRGSLHTMLHGKHEGENGGGVEWNGRMRIAIGATKGLLHIHRQRSGNFGHGNIKASNIFVNSQGNGCVDIKPSMFRISNYHPSEVLREKKVTQASDVYSFGVVLMELLSGKSPTQRTFVSWAIRNACDEWTAMVFDRGLLKYSLVKQEMRDMLGVALCCVKKKPQERPTMKDVVEMLELMPTTFTL